MFTSEPSLTQRIGRMIGDITIIDAQTRIDSRQAGAPDLAALMRDPFVLADLAAVGMPPADLDPSVAADEQVRRVIPHLKACRNTANAWCLYRIFRDLYDFDEPHLDLTNYRDLFDKVAALAKDPEWAPSILFKRSRVARALTNVDPREAAGSPLADQLDFAIDAGWFIPLAVPNEPFHPQVSPGMLDEVPTTRRRMERLIFDWLDRTVTPEVRFVSIPLIAVPPFTSIDPTIMEGIWGRFWIGKSLSQGECEALTLDAARLVLRWHDDHRRLIRIDVPVPPPGVASNRQSGRLLASLVDMAQTFRNARFDIAVGPAIAPHDVAALAGRWPHVFVSGIAWGNASAGSIAEAFGHRVQAVPASKFVGFASQGGSVEWSYGRLQLAKKAMGSALGRLIEDGFFEEDEIPPLIYQVLHATPRDLYALGNG